MGRAGLAASLLVLTIGCSTAEPSAPAPARPPSPPSAAAAPAAPPAPGSADPPGTPAARAEVALPSPPPAEARPPMPPAHRVDTALSAGVDPASASTCATAAEGAPRVRCRIEARWAGAGELQTTSLALWDEHRVVVGLEPEHWMDGGFRGRLHLVPEAPRGPYARHLAWLRDAHHVMADVLAGAAQRARPAASMRFRHQGVVYGFFRSVGRTTPSAYASDWRIGYNVSGSLLGTRDGVIDTLFHEIFHLNDQGDAWSEGALRSIHDGIVARCGARSACLAPYAPTKTIVRGGTYYSFQPDNGDAVHEYAAEVATRWFQEHRALLEGSAPPAKTPFKCGAAENAAAWNAVADAFFAGVDLVPPCATPPP